MSPETARQFSHFNVAVPKVAGNKGLFGGAFEDSQDYKIEFSCEQVRFQKVCAFCPIKRPRRSQRSSRPGWARI